MNTSIKQLRQSLNQQTNAGKALVMCLEYQHDKQYQPEQKKERGLTTEEFIRQLVNDNGTATWIEDDNGGKEKTIHLPEHTRKQIARLEQAVIPTRDMLLNEYIVPMKATHFISFHPSAEWKATNGSPMDAHQRKKAEKLLRYGYNNMRKRTGEKSMDILSIMERSPNGRLHFHAMVRMPDSYYQLDEPEKAFSKDLYISWAKTKYLDDDHTIKADDRYINFNIQRMKEEDWKVCAGYIAKTAYKSNPSDYAGLDKHNTRVTK